MRGRTRVEESSPRADTERGSALMLVPAGVMILLALGAIAVDSAVAFNAQRELENQTIAVANDAVTVALDDDALQQGDSATIDPARAERLVRSRLSTTSSVTLTGVQVQVTNGGQGITVTAEGEQPFIFAKAIPGAKHSAHVRAQATAELVHRNAS